MIPARKSQVLTAATAAFLALASLGASPQQTTFMSLSRDKVFLRDGPTYQHRVLWIYHRKDLPVEVVTSYDVWRRVRDHDGTVGWINNSMLSARRTVLVTAKRPVAVRAASAPDAKVITLAQPGVVAKLEACEALVCEISASGTEGWIQKKDIWGVGAGEIFR